MTDSGIDDNRIRWAIRTKAESIGYDDDHLRPRSEIVPRSLSKAGIDLDRSHVAAPADDLREDGAVVADAGADVNDVRAGRKVELIVEFRPQAGLAIIDAAADSVLKAVGITLIIPAATSLLLNTEFGSAANTVATISEIIAIFCHIFQCMRFWQPQSS